MRTGKFLSFILCSLLSGQLAAQTEKGTVLLGLSSTIGEPGRTTGLSYTEFKEKRDDFEGQSQKTLDINLSPRVGYFIMDHLAVGIDLNARFIDQKDNYIFGGTVKQTRLSAGPFARYYLPLKRLLPFAEMGASFGTAKVKFEDDPDPDDEFKAGLFGFGGGLGLAVPLGSKVSFDTFVGYRYFSEKDKEDNEDNSKTLYQSVILKLGFTLYLGLKKSTPN